MSGDLFEALYHFADCFVVVVLINNLSPSSLLVWDIPHLLTQTCGLHRLTHAYETLCFVCNLKTEGGNITVQKVENNSRFFHLLCI